MSDLPSWYPGTESKPAPMPLLRVQAFLNTIDVEDDVDLLAEPAAARDWLIDAGMLAPGSDVTDTDLDSPARSATACAACSAPRTESLPSERPRIWRRCGGSPPSTACA